MIIRKMNDSDLEKVSLIEERCFLYNGWNLKQFEYELNENPYASLWVICDEKDEIIGYYDLWIIFERAEIATIAVDLPYQSKGLGNQLMQHLENLAKDSNCETISLEVRQSNKPAISLYEKYGFVVINKKPGYYETSSGFEDAYFMMKGI